MFIPSMSGRQRYNVPGAIDAIRHNLLTVCNETYINAVSECELLNKIREKYDDKIVRIMLDNAKNQKSKQLQELADTLNIELLFLPF
jgi:transposase